MNLNLTEEEAKKLVDIIFIGEMIINGARMEEDIIEDYDKLKKKVYEQLHKEGIKDILQYSEQLKSYEVETDYGFDVYDFISEYEDEAFWEELPFKLAVRDIETNGVEYTSTDEYRDAVIERERMYKEEFEKNGVERLKIDEAMKIMRAKHHHHDGDDCGCGCGHEH